MHPSRVKEINVLKNSFTLSNKEISDYLLDTCLIHKSYRNEVKNKNLDTNEMLSFWFTCIKFYMDEYLFENFTAFAKIALKI